MKQNSSSKTVFQRMREQRRLGQRFEPTPVPATSIELPRTTASNLGIYATPMDFSDHTGVSLPEVTRMLDQGELTHLRLGLDGPMVHVRKGLADLERLEQGPAVAMN